MLAVILPAFKTSNFEGVKAGFMQKNKRKSIIRYVIDRECLKLGPTIDVFHGIYSQSKNR